MRASGKVLAGTVFLFALAVGAALPGGAAAETEGGNGKTVMHEVQEGDNLHLIAGYYYKDPRQWRRIFDRNSSTLEDADTIAPGTVLRVDADPDSQWDIPYAEFRSRIFD